MFLMAVVLLPALSAEELTLDLDPAKTAINFVLSDVLHTVHGTFQLKRGGVSFDPATSTITGDIVVDAGSGKSGSAIRDKRMSRDILDVRQYPEIRFIPTKMTGSLSTTGISSVVVSGSFLIHGQPHEIKVPMQIQVSAGDITATGKFVVPYVRWGMKNPSNFLLKVNDKVEIDLTAVGHITRSHNP
jgi:polyisoprenoid-binding protein YceI